ncbi:MAG TPA: DoxX family membrane protein [Candidatus Paceibacterota bacterium]
MIQSLKYSNLALRLSLAIVFFWFGIDKFFRPDYWVNAWVPQSVSLFAENFKMRPIDIIYISGVFEILVGTSLVTNIFIVFFSMLSLAFLGSIMFFNGFSEVLVRDIGLMGMFLSLIFWPKHRGYQ